MNKEIPLTEEMKSPLLTPERRADLQKASDLALELGNFCLKNRIGMVMLAIHGSHNERGYVHWTGNQKRH